MKVLLLESCMNRLKHHRPNLALARFSTLNKRMGHQVAHAKITHEGLTIPFVPDKIIACAIFSWDVPRIIREIQGIQEIGKKQGKNITVEIGGVGTCRLGAYIEEHLGVSPFLGIDPVLDQIPPDPAMIPEDVSYFFTSRGCPGGCAFCAVKDIEGPCAVKIPGWQQLVDFSKKEWKVMDNNPLALPQDDREELFSFLRDHCSGEKTGRRIRVCSFDSGLDFRRLDEEVMCMMQGIRFSEIKLAWDDVRYEAKFDQKIKLILEREKNRLSGRGLFEHIRVYVLYNFNDTLEDALYRVDKLFRHYRVMPYLMRYSPLESLTYKTHVDANWTKEDAVDVGRWCNNRKTFMSTGADYSRYVGRTGDGRSISNFTTYLASQEQLNLFHNAG